MIVARWMLVLVALLGAIGVGIGAMGAHMLPKQLEARGHSAEVVAKKVDQCRTAVHYHLIHIVAILTLGGIGSQPVPRMRRVAGGLMLLGVLLFSGGLYSMVYLDAMGHWAIVPSGGVCFMLGWILAAVSFTSRPSVS